MKQKDTGGNNIIESFRVIRPNLLEVRARTDPDLPGLVIFYVFQ